MNRINMHTGWHASQLTGRHSPMDTTWFKSSGREMCGRETCTNCSLIALETRRLERYLQGKFKVQARCEWGSNQQNRSNDRKYIETRSTSQEMKVEATLSTLNDRLKSKKP